MVEQQAKVEEGDIQKVVTLEGVKVGDIFMRYSAGWTSYLEKLTCERVTAKQAVIGSETYRISDARLFGRRRAGYHSAGDLLQFDEVAYQRDCQRKQAASIKHNLSLIRWNAVSDDMARAVWALLDTKPEDAHG